MMLNEIQEKKGGNLEVYGRVLLVETEDDNADGVLLERLLNSQALCRSRKDVLVLPVEGCKELAELYYTYEFSDRLSIIGRSNQHGSLMNFIDNGLLTEQEVFDLMLR